MERLVVEVIALLIYITYCVHGEDAGCRTFMPHTTLVTRRRDTCYQFVSDETSWRSARSYCYRYGGRLVNIDDPGTNDFILETLDSLQEWTNNGIWIGLHDRGDELNWRWDAGDRAMDTPMTWSNWARGHPAAFLHSMRDCVRMARRSNWKWHETPCNLLKWKYRFICEYDAENPTTAPPMPGWNRHWGGKHSTSDDKTYRQSSIGKTEETTQPDITEGKTDNEEGWLLGASVVPLAAHRTDEKARTARSAGWIAPLGAALLVIIVAVILFVFFIKRRRQNKEATANIYSNPAVMEKPIYKKKKQSSGGWLHEGRVNRPNDYVLDWTCPSPYSQEHLYEECHARGARYTSPVYANEGHQGKVLAISENDNVDNEDTEKHQLLKKTTVEGNKTTNLYLPMDGSVSSLRPASSCSTKPQPSLPASDDGYQVPKPLSSEYHVPQPLHTVDVGEYEVPRSEPKVAYDVPQPVVDLRSASETDDETQHIYESIDEINARRKSP